jgi:phosphoenolpyruvate synthase/pyruvate phosphate dikinase
VIINTAIPLRDVSNYSSRQVGKYALELNRISTANIKTTDGFVIPVETIKRIAHHNNLLEKIKVIEETNDWQSDLLESKLQKKIRQLIKNQDIPEDVAQDIIKTYHKYIKKDDFAAINVGKYQIDNISGETNLLESLLEAWSRVSTKQDLLNQALLVKVQKQPQSSGYIQPSLDKKYRYLITVTHGVLDKKDSQRNLPDEFEIDISHGTIVSRHLQTRKTALTRALDGYISKKIKKPNQASISDKQALEIAKIAQNINQKFIGNKRVLFEIINNKIIVTDLLPVINNNQLDSDPILIGQSVTGGYVEGFSQIVKNNHDQNNFPTGHILIKKSLNYLDLKLINQASALIIEDKKLAPPILNMIKDNHIPCIIGVNYACSKLKNDQKIIIDAGNGKIFPEQQIEQNKTKQITNTKIYLSAGNPFRIEKYTTDLDGIFLKSDYAIAFMGVHPNHLLKNRKHLFEQNLTKTVETFLESKPHDFFYRSCNLNSAEMNSLHQSLNYESAEQSPYLGTRGAIRIIQDSQLFEAELSIISQIAQKQKKTVNFVIPFVRTSSELAIIFKIIEKTIPKSNYIKFWLQLNTPANVINLKEFLHLPISGVTFQAKTIHDLTYGLDPDNLNLLNQYTFDTELIKIMFKEVVETVKNSHYLNKQAIGSIPVVLKLNHYNSELVTTAAELGIRAIVVKPQLLDIVKQQILSTETKILNQE